MDTSGVVSVTWRQWHITTSLNIILVGFFGVFCILVMARWVKNKIWLLLNLSEEAQLKKTVKGVHLLEKSLIQGYLGTEEQKKELLKEAEKFLPNSGLPKLLRSYHAGEEVPKVSTFQDYGALKMLSKVSQDRKDKNWKALENFFQTAPKNLLKEGWFWRESFFYRKEIKDWVEAKKALENCRQYQGLSKEKAQEEKAIVFYNLGMEDPHPLKQLECFQVAFAARPNYQDNAVAYAEALHRQKDSRGARKVLVSAWVLDPSLALAKSYADLFALDNSPTSHAHTIRELYEMLPENPKGQQCFVISLLRAKLWAEAGLIIERLPQGPQKTLLNTLLTIKEKKMESVPLHAFRELIPLLPITDFDESLLD